MKRGQIFKLSFLLLGIAIYCGICCSSQAAATMLQFYTPSRNELAGSFVVPDGVTSLSFELWGAGGNGGSGGNGGAGGFASGTLSVSPGQLVPFHLGRSVIDSNLSLFGTTSGGTDSGPNSGIAIVGAGGAGGTDGAGGAGGGLTGQNGTGTNAGLGGTQFAGGGPFDAIDLGFAIRGVPQHFGDASEGYWNGGTALPVVTEPTPDVVILTYGGGGGGSGYLSPQVTNGVLLTGDGMTPPATSAPGYIAGAGVGGSAGFGLGGDAELVIIFNTPEPASFTLLVTGLVGLAIMFQYNVRRRISTRPRRVND